MAQISTNEFKTGIKIELNGQPYTITANEFVKPGKGQAFNRTKLKHLTTGRVVEKTFKSGEKFDIADVHETHMRLLYVDKEEVSFMDDTSFEQIAIPLSNVEDVKKWFLEEILYDIILYNGEPVTVTPPTFMELKVTETAPGERGNTASGRVLKPAILESGAEVQVPIFIQEEEVVKVDTRTGEYVSRVSK
jgi:elongation factor P